MTEFDVNCSLKYPASDPSLPEILPRGELIRTAAHTGVIHGAGQSSASPCTDYPVACYKRLVTSSGLLFCAVTSMPQLYPARPDALRSASWTDRAEKKKQKLHE